MIIALGESLIAAGVATSELDRGAVFAVTTAGAVVATCALWWTYFGALHGAFEQQMSARGDDTRGQFARDVFSLWHAAVVAGVIGIAVGFEAAIAHPQRALPSDAALALTVGVALFIGGAAGAAARAQLRGVVAKRVVLVVVVLLSSGLVPRISAAATLWLLATAATVLAITEARPQRGLPSS